MDPGPKPKDNSFGTADELFAEALELPSGEREAFVRNQQGDEPDLVRSVLALLAEFDHLGSFLSVPAVAIAQSGNRIAVGNTLIGRFRIGEQLGQGGMGVVYRAEDFELGETVALKMVRDMWLDDPGILARFREELRLARKISHPNVCRIYDLFTYADEGRPRAFFTMEYLDGRCLSDLIRTEWHPEVSDILSIAGGIAAGLDAAHDAGIVHRDLKPGNVILLTAPGGGWRPVIMDFGLAQVLATKQDAKTQTGRIVGSPDYMAPEQFLGEEITPAADVFSLAILIYEIASGKRPWPDESLMRTALRRVSGSTPVLDCGPGRPSRWNTILGNALAREPALRPKRASDLLRQLESTRGAAHDGENKSLLPSRRTFVLGSGATSMAASCFYAVYRFTKQDEPLRGDPVLMLTPIEPYAGYTDSKALDFLMQTQLRQSAHLQILDGPAVENAWKRMHGGRISSLPSRFEPTEAREVAWFARARFVLFSSISRTGDDYKLELKLEGIGSSPAYPEAVRMREFRADDEKSLLRASREGVNWIRANLGEMPVDIAARAFPPEELTTGNWRALLEFLRADEAWREEIHGRRADESIRRLRAALQLDPDFALAAGRLGDLLVAIGQEDEGVRYQQTAIGLMDRRDLTDRESLRIRAMYYQDTGQDEKAENLFSLWAIEYPKEGIPLFYKSKSLMRLGRDEEAFALRSRAARLNPESFALGLGAAQALLEAGHVDDAERAAASLTPGGLTDRFFSCIEFARYNPAGVRKWLDRMLTRNSDPFQFEARALSACLLAEQGRWKDAESDIRAGIRLALDRSLIPSIFSGKLILAKLQLRQGKMAEARRVCEEILDLKPGNRRTMEVGCLLARSGATARAAACMSRLPDAGNPDQQYLATPAYMHWRKRLSAEIALAQNRGEAAVAWLADAPPAALLDDWPEYLVSAYLAAEKYDRAKELLSALFRNPGRYWRLADTTGPGFLRWSVEQATKRRLFDSRHSDFAHLRNALNA